MKSQASPEDHELVFWALQRIWLAETRGNREGLCVRGGFLNHHISHRCHYRNSVTESAAEERVFQPFGLWAPQQRSAEQTVPLAVLSEEAAALKKKGLA